MGILKITKVAPLPLGDVTSTQRDIIAALNSRSVFFNCSNNGTSFGR